MSIHPPPAPGSLRDRSLVGATRLFGGVFGFLGLVGVLRVGGLDLSADETQDLAGLTVHPATALVWLVMGLVAVAVSVSPARSRIYLIGAGALLVLWAAISLITGGDATTFFTTDWPVVTLYLVLGLGALALAFGQTPEFVEEALAPPDQEAGA